MFLTAVFSAGLLAGPVRADEAYPPAPGHAGLPVVFWGHYMPQVPTGELADNGHAGGNTDAWPFIRQHRTALEDYEAQITEALDAGVNGFALLKFPDPDMFKAAQNVFARTGKRMYLAPEWADLGDDPLKAANTIADFAIQHKDDPCLFHVRGKQLHFTYAEGSWAKGDGLRQAKDLLEKRTAGVEGAALMIVPTVMAWDKTILDRPDLNYTAWPPFEPVKPGPEDWVKNTLWDGATDLNMGVQLRADAIQSMADRVRPYADRFLLVPSFSPGYDSSNRVRQAIHTRFQGLHTLRDGLRTRVEMGFRQLMLSTWNDPCETMTLPSTRSVWGYSSVIRYYHGLAEAGKSPFEKPRAVIAYNPEALFGDQLYIQSLILPEKDAVAADYATTVRLEDENGREVQRLGTYARSANEREDAFAEARLDTTAWAGKYTVLTPRVTVERIDPTTGERRVMYHDLQLAPIRLRYNKLAYYTPYSVDLDRISGEVLQLSSVPAGAWLTLFAQAKGEEPVARLSLAESCLSEGAFRPDDSEAGGKGTGLQRFFVRVSVPAETKVTVRLDRGKISESYARNWRYDVARQVVNGSVAQAVGTRVYRVEPPQAMMQVLLGDQTEPCVTTRIESLGTKPVRGNFEVAGKKVPVTVQLTSDATDANVDFPLPASGEWCRPVYLPPQGDGVRVFHLWALTRDGKVAYSRPIVVRRDGPGIPVTVPFLRTNGCFDDFVNQHDAGASNPFLPSDVVSATVPSSEIPHFKLDLDEGSGTRVNDGGTSQQLGWGSSQGKWIKDGWRGSAVELRNSQITLRSKSIPHGAVTLSFRIRSNGAARPFSLFTDNGWKIRVLESGKIAVNRDGVAVTSVSGLHDGWNHVAVTYDLSLLKIYLDGKLAGEVTAKPTYIRTHSCASIGPTPEEVKATTGQLGCDVDQIEVIGTGLSAAEVGQVFKTGSWR